MHIQQIAKELENRALQDDEINKRLSSEGFKKLCRSLQDFEKESDHKLSMNDVDFLKDYYDLSKFY